ncbi:MAG: phosphosulfolactate synthase [Acidimicrobiales bacterium]
MTVFRLDVPARSGKPRRVGLTHVLDKGMPAAQAAELLRSYARYVDVWKFGWGTAYLDEELPAKAVVLADYDVLSCLGGTLLEVAWTQGKADDLLAWAADKGVACIEVSRGAAPMTLDDKHKLIDAAARRFTVLSEVGSKSVTSTMTAADWATEVAADLDAGATWVLAEGRESGTVGIYHDDGVPRQDVVDAIVAVGGADRIVFEAPRKDQQVWFIQRFGADVNLANIAPGEVLGLETLRLGLRADTMARGS